MAQTISIDRLSKIEGHARLKVAYDKEVVKSVKLEVFEGARFFESMVVGKPCTEIPITTARICGFCSQAHQFAAIDALENALQVSPSNQTRALRELLQIAQILSSHALHLYFLALPDYYGYASAVAMAPEHGEEFKRALRLKHATTEMCSAIGGREIHAITPALGGFRKVPSKIKMELLLSMLKESKKDALETAHLFAGLSQPDFQRPTTYAALKQSNGAYGVTGESISYASFYGEDLKEFGSMKAVDYRNHIREHLSPWSTVKSSTLEGKVFMTGSLARMNLNFNGLSDDSKQAVKESGVSFPSFSPFNNNLAQAIEMVHYTDRAIEIVGNLVGTIDDEPLHALEFCECTGVGAVEAPRGMLFHEYSLDSKGRVTAANIVTPTAQNIKNIEEDIKAFLTPARLKQSKEKIVLQLEQLVRAYDPCISCAAHFLEVDFIKARDGGT